MSIEKNALGLRIKELRDLKELSQAELAKEAKIARTVITMIESGQRYPSEKTLEKIICALKITKDEFYTEEVREQAIRQIQEYFTNNFIENASTNDIIKVYRKMIKDE